MLMPCALGVAYNGESGQAWRAKWFPCAIHEKIATGFSDGERCLKITLLLVKGLQLITGSKIIYEIQFIKYVYKATFFQVTVNEHALEEIRQRHKWVAKNALDTFLTLNMSIRLVTYLYI